MQSVFASHPSRYCASGGLGALSLVAVLVYGAGVPLLYAALLWTCRDAIVLSRPTPLSASLAFLHSALQPSALWWPLVDASRALLLTGFLALYSPGAITQLLFGLISAFGFCVLQLWCAPYAQAGNNLLAMIAPSSASCKRSRSYFSHSRMRKGRHPSRGSDPAGCLRRHDIERHCSHPDTTARLGWSY